MGNWLYTYLNDIYIYNINSAAFQSSREHVAFVTLWNVLPNYAS